jgi:DNA-binding HxlR family transcriptional regulator
VKEIIGNLHKVFESRIRLGIMSILMVNDKIDFTSLKELLDTTDGNLASHLTALEKHQLINVHKQFVGKKPNTKYSATPKGIKLFNEHLDNLEKLLKHNK